MPDRRQFLTSALTALGSIFAGPRQQSGRHAPAAVEPLGVGGTFSPVASPDARVHGLTDDTELIQAILDRGIGSEAIIPPREYVVGPLRITKPVRVTAHGAKFLARPGQSASARMIEIHANGVEIHGLSFDGRNGQCDYGIHASGVADMHLGNLEAHGFGESFIRLSSCQDSSVTAVSAKRCQLNMSTPRVGVIRVQRSRRIHLQNIHIADGQGKALAFGDSEDCTVLDLHVHRQLAEGGTGLYFNNSHNVRVEGGILHLTEQNAVKISRGSTLIHISDLDVLTDHSHSPKARPPCLLIMGGSDSIISDCTFTTRGVGAKQVVRIQDHQAGHACFGNRVERCKIIAVTRIPNFRGVEFLGADDQGRNEIVDCTIRAGQGIRLLRGAGNRILRCDIVATTYGVYGHATSRDTTITACEIESTTRSSAQGIRMEGPRAGIHHNTIRIAGAGHCVLLSGPRARGYVVSKNRCYAGGIAATRDATPGTIVDNTVIRSRE